MLGDLFPGFLSWGYTFGLIALAAMVGGLLTHDRASRERRVAWAPGLLGAIASLLHPWQGEALIALVLVGEGFMALSQPLTRRRIGLTALTVGLAGRATSLLRDPDARRPRLASRPRGRQALVPVGLDRDRDRGADVAGATGIPQAAPDVPRRRRHAPGRSSRSAFTSSPARACPRRRSTRSRGSRSHCRCWRSRACRPSGGAGCRVAGSSWRSPSRWPRSPPPVMSSTTRAKLAAPTEGNGNFINADERDALEVPGQGPPPGRRDHAVHTWEPWCPG